MRRILYTCLVASLAGAMLTGCTVETTLRSSVLWGESESVPSTFDVATRRHDGRDRHSGAHAAGHGEIAAACESTSSASIRIFNPLASGAYRVTQARPSWTAPGRRTALLTSDLRADGPIREAQQRFSPIGLGCQLFSSLGCTLCRAPPPYVLTQDPIGVRSGVTLAPAQAAVSALMCAFILRGAFEKLWIQPENPEGCRHPDCGA